VAVVEQKKSLSVAELWLDIAYRYFSVRYRFSIFFFSASIKKPFQHPSSFTCQKARRPKTQYLSKHSETCEGSIFLSENKDMPANKAHEQFLLTSLFFIRWKWWHSFLGCPRKRC